MPSQLLSLQLCKASDKKTESSFPPPPQAPPSSQPTSKGCCEDFRRENKPIPSLSQNLATNELKASMLSSS